eukprot:7558135-Ditylum_brightwellii.AAC.1
MEKQLVGIASGGREDDLLLALRRSLLENVDENGFPLCPVGWTGLRSRGPIILGGWLSGCAFEVGLEDIRPITRRDLSHCGDSEIEQAPIQGG